MDLGFKIQENNFGIRIRILKCVPIFRQNGQIWLFWPKFGQNVVFGLIFRKQKLKKESESTRYHVYQFSDKTEKFDFFVSNLPEMDF